MTNQALIDKIISDANAEARAIVEVATQQAEEIVRLANDKAQREESDLIERMQTESATIYTRRETVARIDVAKIIGRAKLTAVDRAYDKALDKLCALDDARMIEALVSILKKYCQPNDKIRFAKGTSRAVIEGVLKDSYIAKQSITILDSEGDYRGGMVIVGDKYDTSLTFETLLKAHRDVHEAEILGKLL